MSRTNQDGLNEANPNKLSAFAQVVGLGQALAQLPKRYRGTVATVTADVGTLPLLAKCETLLYCFVMSGTVTGLFIPQPQGGAVGTTKFVAPTPGGDLLFKASDAVLTYEAVYLSPEGELVSETVMVPASGIVTLSGSRKANLLVSANLKTGTTTGAKTIKQRGTAAATTEAEVGLTGTLTFYATDVGAAGGTADVVYYAAGGVGNARANVSAQLIADSNF